MTINEWIVASKMDFNCLPFYLPFEYFILWFILMICVYTKLNVTQIAIGDIDRVMVDNWYLRQPIEWAADKWINKKKEQKYMLPHTHKIRGHWNIFRIYSDHIGCIGYSNAFRMWMQFKMIPCENCRVSQIFYDLQWSVLFVYVHQTWLGLMESTVWELRWRGEDEETNTTHKTGENSFQLNSFIQPHRYLLFRLKFVVMCTSAR